MTYPETRLDRLLVAFYRRQLAVTEWWHAHVMRTPPQTPPPDETTIVWIDRDGDPDWLRRKR